MPSASMSVKSWWISLHNGDSEANIIVTLAVILYGIVPHAASTERDFSIMKWLNAPRRSSQSVATLKRLARVRTTLTSLCQPPRRTVSAMEDDEEVQEVLPDLLLEDLDAEGDPIDPDQLEEALTNCARFEEALSDAATHGYISFTQLLLADEFDLDSPFWQPDYVHVPVTVSRQLLGLTPMLS